MKIKFYFSSNDLTGGHLYSQHAFEALKSSGFEIYPYNVFTNYKGRGHTYLDGIYSWLFSSSKKGDIDIMDYNKSTWTSKKNKASRIIIFHHYDSTENDKVQKYKLLFKNFLKNAQNATIVVVSEYWKEKLFEYGLKNIQVIYNSFETKNYHNFIQKKYFYQKYNLPSKPILYIGKNSKAKTLYAYNMLKFLEKDYLLVTSGSNKEFEGPFFLNLPSEDFKNLLHHSIACLLFTDFIEGWSRIAHESILCGTPVIGNGSGGMKELLQLTNQLVMPVLNLEQLILSIENIHKNNIRVSKEDISRITKFDTFYFVKEWNSLIKQVDSSNKCN